MTHQWVDLDQAGIQGREGRVNRAQEADRGAHLGAAEPQSEGELAGVKGMHPDGGVDGDAQDLLGRRRRHLLDVHAAFGGGDEGDLGERPVDQRRDVELAGDVAAVLDVDPLDLLAPGSGLVRHQIHAQHVLGRGAHVVDRLDHPDAAALAAAAGVDLRLDHPHRATQLLGHRFRLGRGIGDDAVRHRDAVLGQQLFCLVFVNVQSDTLFASARTELAGPIPSAHRRRGVVRRSARVASISERTAATDSRNCARSLASSLTSTTRSTPLAPMMQGTPT